MPGESVMVAAFPTPCAGCDVGWGCQKPYGGAAAAAGVEASSPLVGAEGLPDEACGAKRDRLLRLALGFLPEAYETVAYARFGTKSHRHGATAARHRS